MNNSTNALYDQKIDQWMLIDDVVKSKNLTRHLVRLNSQDKSPENESRNKQYAERAIFYAVTGQTLRGMVGSIFRKWPQLAVPAELDYLKSNADGMGVSIYQQSQAVANSVISKGRAGLYVSFPESRGDISKADAFNFMATIHRFEPEQILDWRIDEGLFVMARLAMTEGRADKNGIFNAVEIRIEMVLEDGIYIERKYSINEKTKKWELDGETIPLDSSGNPWDVLPFVFVGSSDNSVIPNDPPLYPMAVINVGHYRNSADLEDSCWFCGQAQPYMTGLTQDYIDMLKTNNMYVGARNLIGVPSGETFGFAQAAPNPLARQLMIDKIDVMVSMGARLIQPGSATKTATQAAGDIEAQTSVLALAASNISEAYTVALGFVARYMGTSPDIEYRLNQDFINNIADANMLREVVAGFVAGSMPVGDYTRYMRSVELFSDEKTDEEYADQLRMANGGQ